MSPAKTEKIPLCKKCKIPYSRVILCDPKTQDKDYSEIFGCHSKTKPHKHMRCSKCNFWLHK